MKQTASLQPNDQFAGYHIVRMIGRGGMGEIYQARHPRLPRTVALKILNPEHTEDLEFRRRFQRESRIVAGLEHPAIVGVHDCGEEAGRLWISMQYIDGGDAQERMNRAGVSGTAEVARIVRVVAAALDYAHGAGVIHRDVKPSNILIGEDRGAIRGVYVADFGIALPAGEATRITTADSLVGSVDYTAPERLCDVEVIPATDQYSLGCTTFHLLTGRRPYEYEKLTELVSAHLSAPVPSAVELNGSLRPAIDHVLSTAMSKNPADRYPDCRTFAAEVTHALQPPRPVSTGYRVPSARPAPIPAPRAVRPTAHVPTTYTLIDPTIARTAHPAGPTQQSTPVAHRPLPVGAIAAIAAITFLIALLIVLIALI